MTVKASVIGQKRIGIEGLLLLNHFYFAQTGDWYFEFGLVGLPALCPNKLEHKTETNSAQGSIGYIYLGNFNIKHYSNPRVNP